jgi:diguanylate cyclase (GGDEF)-like protein
MFRNGRALRAEWMYALLGILLGFGGPVGQFLARMAASAEVRAAPLAEVRAHVSFYTYELLATSIVFGLAGIAAGRREERLEKAEEFYHRLSERDSLTGLLNARAFSDRIARVAERSARLRQPVSMLLIDVDGLKGINDQHGHAGGNDALLHVASVIDQSKRSDDTAVRWGGDEFAVLLERGDADAAARVAETILARLQASPAVIGQKRRLVTVTIGIATAVERFEPHVLFAAADQALYEGKSRGRNRIAAAPVPPS